MSTKKSNGGPFVTFREECEILRARVVELEAQLEEATTRYQTLMRISQERVDKRDKLILLAKDALDSCGYADDSTDSEMCGAYYDTGKVSEALAAIKGSKAVEGLILCEQDLNYQVGDIITYAPRRTEK